MRVLHVEVGHEDDLQEPVHVRVGVDGLRRRQLINLMIRLAMKYPGAALPPKMNARGGN